MIAKVIFILCVLKTFIFNFVSGLETIQPAVRFSLKDTMINELEQHFLPIFLKNISNIPIADVALKQHIPFIGNVELSLKNIILNIDEVDPKDIKILFNDNNTFSAILGGLNANMTFDYDFKTNFLNSEGTGKGLLNDLSLSMITKLFQLQNKLNNTLYGPGVSIESFGFDHFNLRMSFDKDTPLEKFIIYLADNLSNILQRPVFESLSSYILPPLNTALKTGLENLPLFITVPGTKIGIPFSLYENPRFFNNTIELSFNGKNSSNVIPHSDVTSSKFVVYLNQDFFQSIFDIVNDLGLINFTVYSETIPDSSPIKFDTSSFSLLIPQLEKTYGKDKKMDMKCESKTSPKLLLDLNLTQADASLNCDFIVRKDATSNVTAFTAELAVESKFEVYLRSNFIKGSLKTIKLKTLQILNSQVGPIDASSLQSNLNFILDPVVKLLINVYIGQGQKVEPIYGISFQDSVAESHKGYIQLDLNPVYTNLTVSEVEEMKKEYKTKKFLDDNRFK